MKYRNIFLAAGFAVLLASCSSSKTSLTYFEDIKTQTDGVVNAANHEIYIMPDDELLITVNSLVPSATAQYNLTLINPAVRETLGGAATGAPQNQTYIVDEDGDIDFPVLGKIKVAGMTTKGLTEELVKLISQDVNDPQVKVELLSFNINVLGEVKAPGRYNIRMQRLSVLDALAQAGDMTEYGERSNVLLVREENGKVEYHRLNLNSSELLSSPYYYLQQNDVLYVEPNKIRKDNSKYNQNNAFKLSLTSTIVSATSVIASLIIALTVK